MAVIKHVTILSLVVFLLLALHFRGAVSSSFEDDGDEDDEEYVLDSVFTNTTSTLSRRSRFLASAVIKTIKKGASCGANTKKKAQACNGVSANKGTSLLYCCKKHCRNVLGDQNNCGVCGRKCGLGQQCCGGVCTNVLKNTANCGKCGKKCKHGVKCEYGYCGYA
ncbi:hypothetical protein ACP275_13G080400 [Erythranthe tilingii]